jgi:hypothetical protein
VLTTRSRSRFQTHRDELDDRLRSGDSFEEIEEWIDRLTLGSEHKAALWLWAWSNLPNRRQKKLAKSYIANLPPGD